MADDARIEIFGLERLQSTMRSAGQSLDDMHVANTATAATIATAARARAPRRTGRLARAISGSGTGHAAVVSVGTVYAGVIEYGDPRRNRRAQPYLRPAVAESEAIWAQYYVNETQTKLNTVKGA